MNGLKNTQSKSNKNINCILYFACYMDCVVPEKIYTHPMEGHWKFLGGGGILKTKFLEEMYENKLEFPGGKGCKTKNLPLGEYGYFLELHIA